MSPNASTARSRTLSRTFATAKAKRRGAVLVEYALLLVAVAIPTMLGISAGGVKMYANYQREKALILQNTP